MPIASTHDDDLGHAAPIARPFVRRYREEILAAWRGAARVIPVARELEPVVLVDHIPELLDQIGEVAERIEAGSDDEPTFEMARRHALDRLGEGFDVACVVKELSLLRDCISMLWEREHGSSSMRGLRAIDRAIDSAIQASVTRYAEARERSLRGMDRISTATLEAEDVDDLLQRLLVVFQETTPAVDTAAILLAEEGQLRVRAIVGLERTRGALFGSPDAFVAALRTQGAQTLYGVPLTHDGHAIGVAYMASVTAHELSHDDRQFFDSLAARATVGIVHQLLRQHLGRTLAKLESLLDASPVGIAFVDCDLRYLRINDALAAINGLPAEAHIGRTVRDVLPDIADKLEPLVRTVIASGKPALDLELTHVDSATEETRYLLAHYFPVRAANGTITGVGAMALDVTAVKHTEHALALERARLRAIVEHAPAAIWVKDATGRIVLANHQIALAIGDGTQTLIGRTSDEIFPADIATQHEEHDRIVLDEHRAIEVEETVPSPDGTRTFLSIKFPIPFDPPLVGGIATEITQRKRMEEELRNAVRARDDLLAVVSHDLRSPLGTVQLSASLLFGQLGADNRARRHLDMIVRSCSRMENLIDDLLDSASIRAGRFQLDRSRQSIADVANEALDLQQPLAREKDVKLVRELDLANVELACDRHRLLQVFGNLIGNAIKFCRAGDTITVSGRRGAHELTFAVEDTGPGIAPDALARVFEPYWSGGNAHGTGLGLYIVRGIVESHGGRVWAESTPGRGARFVFTLPYERC